MRFEVEGVAAVDIDDKALETMQSLARQSERETGGILVGFNNGRDVHVVDASDAGPKANASAVHFLRDTEHCRTFLDQQFSAAGADYVGEWHSHVVSLRRLSEGDLKTIAGLFLDPDYDFVSFVIVLVVVADERCDIHVYVAERVDSQKGRRGVNIRFRITELYGGPFQELPRPESA